MLDRVKQQARFSILQKLKQKGMPVSPFPGEEPTLTSELNGEEESLNDFGLSEDLQRKMPKAKKKPQSIDEESY